MKKLFALIIFFMSFFILLSPNYSFASSQILFSDDFENGLNNWQTVHGLWSILTDTDGNHWIGGTAGVNTDYEIQAGDYSWSDYEFSIDVIAKSGIDRNIFFRVNNGRFINQYGHNFPISYGVHISEAEIDLVKWTATSEAGVATAFESFPRNTKLNITFRLQGNNIKIFINGSTIPIIDFSDSNDVLSNGRIALGMITGGEGAEVWYDNVKVTSLEPTSTPQPKIILIPGLGASWNSQHLLQNKEVPQSEWFIPNWMPFYEDLILHFNIGCSNSNRGCFIFAYDWTKPVDQIANDLKDYINNVVKPDESQKIDIVGHSLGGLVGRDYIQKNPDTHKVDKLITLGTPHQGIPQVYNAWEGADIHELFGPPFRLPLEILLAGRAFQYPNMVQSLRNAAPVLKDLLPTFDYLKLNNNQVKPETSLPDSSRNLWLKNLGITPQLSVITSAFVGTIGDTPRWLKIKSPDLTDKILGKWLNGKPVGQEYENGDQTVLTSSAELSGATIINFPLSHNDLLLNSDSQDKIFELLNLSMALPLNIMSKKLMPIGDQGLAFVLFSEGDLQVTNPYGMVITPTEDDVLAIFTPPEGNYKVEVLNKGKGQVNLAIAQLTSEQDLWAYYHDSTVNFNFDTTLNSVPANFLDLAKKDIGRININFSPCKKNDQGDRKIKSSLSKMLSELKKISPTSFFRNNTKNDAILNEVISENKDLMDYVQKKKIDGFTPTLRELQYLLSQLHDLLL